MGTLSGSCHCGAVVVNVARRPRQLTDCNCSICRRYGTLWAYYSPPVSGDYRCREVDGDLFLGSQKSQISSLRAL